MLHCRFKLNERLDDSAGTNCFAISTDVSHPRRFIVDEVDDLGAFIKMSPSLDCDQDWHQLQFVYQILGTGEKVIKNCRWHVLSKELHAAPLSVINDSPNRPTLCFLIASSIREDIPSRVQGPLNSGWLSLQHPISQILQSSLKARLELLFDIWSCAMTLTDVLATLPNV